MAPQHVYEAFCAFALAGGAIVLLAGSPRSMLAAYFIVLATVPHWFMLVLSPGSWSPATLVGLVVLGAAATKRLGLRWAAGDTIVVVILALGVLAYLIGGTPRPIVVALFNQGLVAYAVCRCLVRAVGPEWLIA